MSEVSEISGTEGNFTVTVIQHPRYVDTAKCIACGICAEKCPKKVDDAYNEGLMKRKAIYVPYAQAVPLKFTIDPDNCIYLQKGKCRACEKFCPSGAINFADKESTRSLHVGSLILATGFKSYDPRLLDNYCYSQYPDVITSMEFERMLSATGPSGGHLIRPSSRQQKNLPETHPKKIAWLQCVGSREINRNKNEYCSSVCCMYAVKQAIISKDHDKSLDCTIFYMDMRTQGKNFDHYLESAREQGVHFIPSRIHSIEKSAHSDELRLRYVEDDGKPKEAFFDLVILSTGLEISSDSARLSEKLGVKTDKHSFISTDSFHPVSTSVPGIYACGALTGPKDIPQSVMEASAAACAATEKLATARNIRTRSIEPVAQRNIARQETRIGVFVCNCGTNIGAVVRVPEVAAFAKTLPCVVYVEENLFTCSQDTQDKLAEVIREQDLNRVVIAACTPITHESLFQETLINAGLNKYLVEMANIRNHDSWVHADHPDAATEKAKDLVCMAVAKSALLEPLQQKDLPVTRSALVIGGGIAGMTAALALSSQGYPVTLVEKSEIMGGHARNIYHTSKNNDVRSFVTDLVEQVNCDDRITVYTGSTVSGVKGFIGNFETDIIQDEAIEKVKHGVAVIATGAEEYRPDEYLYGSHAAVLTHLEMDALLRNDDQKLASAGVAVFIQCVGSREPSHPYCSKVCCTHTMVSALELKKRNPDMVIIVLYRDIRTYGTREALYREAREKGILFCRYTPENKPVVSPAGDQVNVEFDDPLLGRHCIAEADILCLATAIEPRKNEALTRLFKIPCDEDGWLLEAHQKLRPVEFATEGVFLCGMSHYPKPIDESIVQAKAAASRALCVLARDRIKVGGMVPTIDERLCSGCKGCINVCSYGAVSFNESKQVAEINEALCKGCGACAAACPSEALVLKGFSHKQIYAQIEGALHFETTE